MTVAVSGESITFADSSVQNTAATGFGFKNRIINGAMVIDQRNAGASVVFGTGSLFPVDRFKTYNTVGSGSTVQRSTTAPAGFVNSMLFTVGTGASPSAADECIFFQPIEGFNVADLGFGTASASSVTVSFQVRSSVTGTYAFRLRNQAGNRSYVATYTVNSANTFETKSVTIPGDTTGTWLTNNSVGILLTFDLGSGSNYNTTAGAWQAGDFTRTSGCVNFIATSGATFYITGVQLEKGSTATSFDYRDYGRELIMCQRYFERSYNIGAATGTFTNGFIGFNTPLTATSDIPSNILFKVTKRDTPTVVVYNAVSGASGAAYRASDGTSISVTGINYVGTNGVGQFTLASGSVNNYLIHYTASSEL
jgi:hypothetical protein